MHPKTADPRDWVTSVVDGYRFAWTHRRHLLTVLVAVLAPALVLSFGLDLFYGGDQAAIIDGALVFGTPAGAWWVKPALVVLSWLVALTAATALMVRRLRGEPVSPGGAIAIGLRHLPVLALGTGAVLVAVFAILAVFGGWLEIAALVVLAVVAARLLYAVPALVFGGLAWQLTKRRVMATAGAIIMGGVIPGLLAAQARPAIWPVAVDLFDAMLLIGTVAVQASILATVYTRLREAEPDLAAHWQGAHPWKWGAWMGAAALVSAIALPSAVAAANPYGAPVMSTHARGPAGGALAVAWPSGQHPIIVTSGGGGVWFCDDDLCSRFTQRNGGPAVGHRYGTVAIGPDGTVVKGALTGGEDSGGPFIHYGRCTRDGCKHGWIPARASSDEPFEWHELAVSGEPNGDMVFFLWSPTSGLLTQIRCPGGDCAKPERRRTTVSPRPPADHGYRTTAVRAEAPPGVRIHFGQRPQYWRQILLVDNRRIPLDVFEGPPRKTMVAVSTDGRVLVVREDRITLLPSIPAGSTG